MRIVRMEAAGASVWPDVALDDFAAGLNVVFGGSPSGKSLLAQLAGHLLFGKPAASWRQTLGDGTTGVAGAVEVAAAAGDYVLRRRAGERPERASVTGLRGAPTDAGTPSTLLYDLSPAAAGQLYAVDFARSPAVERLLSADFARQFGAGSLSAGDPAEPACALHAAGGTLPAGSPGVAQRLDELFALRDATARDLEEALAAARHESEVARQESCQLEAAVVRRRAERDGAQRQLQAAEQQRADRERRLRYFAVESLAGRFPRFDGEQHQRQVASLDLEIARCRDMLAALQGREASLQRELAELRPDGTADQAAPLADQRAALIVVERLLDEVDAEVDQLARAHEPGRCVGLDAHARLAPLAQLLRHQTYAMCGQLAEQQRAVRRGQLQAEARQVARAQVDLSEQLEHLLDRRQALFHAERAARKPQIALPEAPVAGLCQCAAHESFVAGAEAAELLRRGNVDQEPLLREQLQNAEREVARLRQALQELDAALSADERRWEMLQRERQGSLDPVRLEELRATLARLEAQIDRALSGADSRESPPLHRVWKASDVLAQLTGGELVQIRLQEGGRDAAVLDAQGRILPLRALDAAQRDQLYLALTLALASAHAARGIELPLLLDEPFLRQSPAAAATMAGVLAAFAREGRQTIVFTGDREVRRRCETLGARIHQLDAARQIRVPRPETVAVPPPEERPAETHIVRVVREGSPRGDAPRLRVAGAAWEAGEDAAAVHFLDPEAPLSEFPVLGPETGDAFARCQLQTIGDLLRADPEHVASQLERPEVTAPVVRLWQTHTRLMCALPGLSLNDAQVLSACGVAAPGDVARADLQGLQQRILGFLAEPRGKRFAGQQERFQRDRLQMWQEAARALPDASPPAEAARAKAAPKSAVEPSAGSSSRRASGPQRRSAASGALRFFLGKSSSVVDAPSIGEKAAADLQQAGIRTVRDLLQADPASVAEELAIPRLTAERIVQWQRQARLMCCVPELRGYGAQLLVACGIGEPQQLAAADAAKLGARIDKLCRTTAGQRMLRGSKPPSRQRVAQWIAMAARRRPLEAA